MVAIQMTNFYLKLKNCSYFLALGMWRVSRGIFKDIWEEAEEAEKQNALPSLPYIACALRTAIRHHIIQTLGVENFPFYDQGSQCLFVSYLAIISQTPDFSPAFVQNMNIFSKIKF